MTSRPRISVVIPSRRPEPLARCLAALARSELAAGELEAIVVVDGEDVAMPSRRDDGLAVRWIRQPRSGPAAARNRGAEEARGAVLAFVDDDCEPTPQWARRLAERVEAQPEAVVGGRVVNGLPENPWAVATHVVLDMVVEYVDTFVPSSNVALRPEVFRAVGGFDTRFPRAAAEDRDFCDRCDESGHPVVLERAAVVLHRHHLTATRFWRQHVNYGHGAVAYQLARRRRGRPRSLAPTGFYPALASCAARRRQLARVAASQVAYGAGIVSGLLDRRLRSG